MGKRKTYRVATCPWCGKQRTLDEMRDPSATRGKTPTTCYSCRASHPSEAWCRFHGEPHPRSEFAERPNVTMGIQPECRKAAVIKASRKRGHRPITCVSCSQEIESWNFRGGQRKSPTCRKCEEVHAEQRWCTDCAGWLPESEFHRTGAGGKFWTVRCKRCKAPHAHGVTYRELLERQGIQEPECAACGSKDELKVDHDHNHCDASTGCSGCVRGWLCHSCNTAEGLLRTPDRAMLLAEYMLRFASDRQSPVGAR